MAGRRTRRGGTSPVCPGSCLPEAAQWLGVVVPEVVVTGVGRGARSWGRPSLECSFFAGPTRPDFRTRPGPRTGPFPGPGGSTSTLIRINGSAGGSGGRVLVSISSLGADTLVAGPTGWTPWVDPLVLNFGPTGWTHRVDPPGGPTGPKLWTHWVNPLGGPTGWTHRVDPPGGPTRPKRWTHSS